MSLSGSDDTPAFTAASVYFAVCAAVRFAQFFPVGAAALAAEQ
jgi:hypothetical protein